MSSSTVCPARGAATSPTSWAAGSCTLFGLGLGLELGLGLGLGLGLDPNPNPNPN